MGELDYRRGDTIEILVVVEASRGIDAKGEGEKNWALQVDCAGWRMKGGPLHESPICLAKAEIRESELDELLQQIKPGSLLRLNVFVERQPREDGSAELTLLEVLGTHRDRYLEDIADRLQKPVVIEDEMLGPLTLNRRLGWYEGKTDWLGQTIQINLWSYGDESALPQLEAAAHKLWQDQVGWSKQAGQCALDHLLDFRNEVWRGQDEPEVSREAFLEQLSLETIAIDSDGDLHFYLDDGDLFWGNCIVVFGNVDHGFKYADVDG